MTPKVPKVTSEASPRFNIEDKITETLTVAITLHERLRDWVVVVETLIEDLMFIRRNLRPDPATREFLARQEEMDDAWARVGPAGRGDTG